MPGGVGTLNAFNNRLLDHLDHFIWHRVIPLPLELILLDNGNNSGCLFATHDRDACSWPEESEAWIKGWATHGIVPCAKAPSADNGKLWDRHIADSIDHLGTILGDATLLKGCTNDKTCDVVKEDQGCATLAAHLDEMCSFDRSFTEKHAIVSEDAYWIALNVGKATDNRHPVLWLELVEARTIHDSSNDLSDIIGQVSTFRDDP